MSSLDDKSGYDLILLDEDSRKYMGSILFLIPFPLDLKPVHIYIRRLALQLVDTVGPWGCLAYSI